MPMKEKVYKERERDEENESGSNAIEEPQKGASFADIMIVRLVEILKGQGRK